MTHRSSITNSFMTRFILAGFVVLLLALLVPEISWADAGPLVGEIEGAREVPENFKCRTAAEAPFTVRVTSCVRQMLWQSVLVFIDGIWPWTQAITGMCLILAMTFHGFRMTAGMLRNPWNDTFWLCFKAGTMYAIMYNYAVLYDYPYRIMDFLLYVATSSMPFNIPGEVSGFMVPGPACSNLDGAEYDTLLVWKRFDCMFGMIMGFTATAGVGLIPIIIVVLLTGVGMFLVWPVINFIIFMIEVALKAILIYVTALLHIAVLLMILPFILPTILFKTTYDIFSKWVAEMFDAMIQPIFVFTFMNFMLLLLRDALNDFIASLGAWVGGRGVGAITAACDSVGVGVSDARSVDCVQGTGENCTAHTTPQANMCLDPAVQANTVGLIDVLTNLMVLMMVAYLIALFFEHLASMASRLIRITGSNYFQFVGGLAGGNSNNSQMVKDKARDQMMRARPGS